MSVEASSGTKRPYASPTLFRHGTMVALTRTGTGSRVENKSSESKNKRA